MIGLGIRVLGFPDSFVEGGGGCWKLRRMSMERRNDQYSGSNPESSYNFKGRSKSKTSRSSWMISDPEVKRKKRVATYKVFTVEGKVKATVRSSCRWLKAKYIEVRYGWW